MTSIVVAFRVDGQWMPAQHPTVDRHDVIDASMSGVDQAVAHLARVVRLAQGLNDADKRRVRDLVHATIGALTASTYLPTKDQEKFQQALRDGK